jgi:hypothetical protein
MVSLGDLESIYTYLSDTDTLIYALSKFVSIASVTPGSAHEKDCLDAANFLKGCLSQLGAHSTLVYHHRELESLSDTMLGTDCQWKPSISSGNVQWNSRQTT